MTYQQLQERFKRLFPEGRFDQWEYRGNETVIFRGLQKTSGAGKINAMVDFSFLSFEEILDESA